MGNYASVAYLPEIHTYERAKYIYDKIVPIRGSKGGQRPLGERRYKHIRIDKGADERGEYYAGILYRTECIKWYADRSVHVTYGGYRTTRTTITKQFINEILRNMLSISVINGYYVVAFKGLKYPMLGDGLWFKDGGVAGIVPVYTKAFRKPAIKQLRVNAKPLSNYVRNMKQMGLSPDFSWQMRWDDSGLMEILHTYVDAAIGREIPLDKRLRFFNVSNATYREKDMIQSALRAGVVREHELYIETELPVGEFRKGCYTK